MTVHVPADVATEPPASGWRGWWRDGWSRFRQNKLSLVGLAIVVVVVLARARWRRCLRHSGRSSWSARGLRRRRRAHLFGTDHLGRDVFSGVLYGTRTSLQVGFLSVILSVVLGITIGVDFRATTAAGSTTC